jgi:hypothetical protein
MRPIELEGGPFLSLDEFRDFFIKTCEEHRKQNRAKAFAFIVYDFTNENAQKILRDGEYSRALHKLSGKWLTIFYVNTKDPEFSKLRKNSRKTPAKLPNKRRLKNNEFGNIYFNTARELDFEKTPSYLREIFDVSDYTALPFIVFFQTKDNRILRSFSIAIKGHELEAAYKELKELVANAVTTISRMQCFDDPDRILYLIEDAVNGSRNWKRLVQIAKPVATAFGLEVLKKIIIG